MEDLFVDKWQVAASVFFTSFTAIVAVFGFLELVAKFYEKILIIADERERKKNLRRLVVIPTNEELAKFSVKSFEKENKEDIDFELERLDEILHKNRKQIVRRVVNRIRLIRITFSLAYLLLVVRLVQLGVFE